MAGTTATVRAPGLISRLLVGVAPPAVGLLVGRQPVDVAAAVVMIIVGLVLAMVLPRVRHRFTLRLLALIAAGVILGAAFPQHGRGPVAYFVVATAVVDWGLGARELRTGAAPPLTLIAVLGASGVAWVRWQSSTVAILGLASAIAIDLAMGPADDALETFDRMLGRTAGRVVRWGRVGAVTVLALPVLFVPAFLATPLRWIANRRLRRQASTWRKRSDEGVDERAAHRPFGAEPRRRTVPRHIAAASLAVAAVALVLTTDDAPSGSLSRAGAPSDVISVRGPDFRLAQTSAFRGVPWANEIQTEHDSMPAVQDWSGLGLGNFVGRYTTMTHSVRKSIQSTCTCPEVKIWWFGGSAAFGWYQRDDHTVPSELVRLAERDGIRLTIENRASAGYTIWQEYQMFSSLLALTPERPDLAVFFDGYNDVVGSAALAHRLRAPVPPAYPALSNISELGALRDPTLQFTSSGGPDAVGTTAAEKYLGFAGLIKTLATANGTSVAFVLQPDALASPTHLDEMTLSAGVDGTRFANSDLAKILGASERVLGPRMIDLRHAFDQTLEPIFADSVHINERGAQLVAARLYAQLSPQLGAAMR